MSGKEIFLLAAVPVFSAYLGYIGSIRAEWHVRQEAIRVGAGQWVVRRGELIFQWK